jgi:hypothetical protein
MTEPNIATATTDEGSFDLSPTALYRMDRDTQAAAVVEGPEGGDRALIVLRSEEEAGKYRAATGNHPEAEGWRPVALGLRELSDLLEIHGCSHVAMPEPWTGTGGVDFFAAADFIGMLEAAPMFLDALEN